MALRTPYSVLRTPIAIRAAGGQDIAVEQLGDGAFSAPDPVVTPVVHPARSSSSTTTRARSAKGPAASRGESAPARSKP